MQKLKAHTWFFLTAALILLTGIIRYVIDSDSVSDINIHDTYYVIPEIYFTVAFTILYLIAGSIYWLLRNFRLMKFLTVAHTFLSIVIVILFWTLLPIFRMTDNIFVQRAETTQWILYAVAIFAQQLFIINITISLIKGRKR